MMFATATDLGAFFSAAACALTLGCSVDSRKPLATDGLPNPSEGELQTGGVLDAAPDAAGGGAEDMQALLPLDDTTAQLSVGRECEAEARDCSDSGEPRFCDPGGRWQIDVPCDLDNPACFEGGCFLCAPGALRCNEAGVPETCSPEGTSWQPGSPCGGESPVCVPETGVCGQCSAGSRRACVEEAGNCASGQQLCQDDSRWGPCDIQPQLADSCVPGDDASCDGQPNGGCACTVDVACGHEEEIGICRRGSSACSNAVLGTCQGAINPAERDCTSPFDNDCDGVPDSTLDATCECQPNAVEECDEHVGLDGVGICRAGTRTCVTAAGGVASRWGACQGATAPRARDCRSNLDNDCNGRPDNALDTSCICVPNTQRDCGADPSSFGCARGTQTCEALDGGSRSNWGQCRFAPVTEGTTCDDANVLTVSDHCEQGRCEGRPWGDLATGNGGVCVIRSGGVPYCWSSIGATRTSMPQRVTLPEAARSLSVGARQACAVGDSGALRCWGSNDAGQLGTGNLVSAPPSAPASVSGITSARLSVAGAEGTAALDSSGTPRFWGGLPAAIFLSTNPSFRPLSPVPVNGVGGAIMLALGARHACSLLPDNQVYCWGQNEFLQRGGGEQTSTASGTIVPNVTDAIFVEAGSTSTCVVRVTGQVRCWGSLGCPNAGCAPADVPQLPNARQVSIGGGTACALRADGSVVCWGQVAPPQGGMVQQVTVPVAMAGLNDIVLLGASDELDGHCALRSDGEVLCWTPSLPVQAVMGLPD